MPKPVTVLETVPSAAAPAFQVSRREDEEPVAELLPEGAWLMDTGCRQDIISAEGACNLSQHPAKKICFHAANGEVATGRVVRAQREALRGDVEAYVLPSTPRALSIGRRCVEEGYSFAWVANAKPTLIAPGGEVVQLEVIENIPYLMVGSSAHEAAAAVGVPFVSHVVNDHPNAAVARSGSPSASRRPYRSIYRGRGNDGGIDDGPWLENSDALWMGS